MLAHVYQFGTFGETAPWVFQLIGFVLAAIAAVHIYRSVRKRRARARRKADLELLDSGLKARPLLPMDLCPLDGGRGSCPIIPEMPPDKCKPGARQLCRRDFPELHSREGV